ncbi:MAG: type III pantothenate kinase [Chloroflexi bacterium]|nr:type III pantothenate kinase [Chloroflexota bacterium]
MFLAIDAGNTHTVFGLYDKQELIHVWRLGTDARRSSDEYRALLASLSASAGIDLHANVDAVAIGSVVPPLTQTLVQMCQTWFRRQPLIMHADLALGIAVRVKEPRRVGADRLLNAVAASALYGAPCLILDFGTATKFDVVDADGAFVGGAIAPGFYTSASALIQDTALLPTIDLDLPAQPIGDDTVSAMSAGIVLGYLSLVEGMVQRIRHALQAPDCPVIATGGVANLLAPHLPLISHHHPNLTLEGLRLVYERNST